MKTTITFNKIILLKKSAIQLGLVAIFALSVIIIFNPWGPPLDVLHLLLRILLCLLLLFFNTYMFVQLLFMPIGASFDDSAKKIEAKFLLTQSKIIQFDDIEAYGSIMVYTKKKDHEGILVHLKTGKTILLSNFNLRDYKPVEVFLKKAKIKYLGKEEFSFVPYYKQWLM